MGDPLKTYAVHDDELRKHFAWVNPRDLDTKASLAVLTCAKQLHKPHLDDVESVRQVRMTYSVSRKAVLVEVVA